MIIKIQDIIVDKVPIPHYIALGSPNAMKDQLVEVRMINTDVQVEVRPGKYILFQTGKPTSNIEYIIYSCILLNDLLDIDSMQDLVPSKPETVRLSIDRWLSLVIQDEVPESWFVQHRNSVVSIVHLDINFGENKENLLINAGTDWSDIMMKVQHRLQVEELAQNDLNGPQTKTDYSLLHSPPNSIKSGKKEIKVERSLDDFLDDALGVLNV